MVLPSGLRVLVLRIRRCRLVDVQAVWAGRAAQRGCALERHLEPAGGDAHARHAQPRRAGSSRPSWARCRASLTGFSTRDSLGLRAELPADAWERGLELLADCIAQSAVLRRRARAGSGARCWIEIRAQAATATARRLAALFASALWTRHPYRLPELGTADSVASLSRRRLVDHYRRYYGVGGLTIAVVGNVEPARVVAKHPVAAGRRAGAAAGRPRRSPSSRRAASRSRCSASHAVRRRAGGDRLSRDHAARSRSVARSRCWPRSCRAPSGRLAAAFREQRPFVRGSSAHSRSRRIDRGLEPGSGDRLRAARRTSSASVRAARAELARVVERGVTADEVGRARRYLIGAHAVALEPRSALAAALASRRGLRPGAARVPPLRATALQPHHACRRAARGAQVHRPAARGGGGGAARPTTIARRGERAGATTRASPSRTPPARSRQERGARARPEETTRGFLRQLLVRDPDRGHVLPALRRDRRSIR